MFAAGCATGAAGLHSYKLNPTFYYMHKSKIEEMAAVRSGNRSGFDGLITLSMGVLRDG